jgi:tetratricopeptide (TPR) repeat protein
VWWWAAPRGDMSDCIGCEPTAKVRHLSWRGQDEAAVAMALPVLGGQLTCVEQPHSMLTELLLPYLRTGRLEEAAAAHRQAYRAVQTNRGELGLVGQHVAFCAYTGNLARGLELVARHVSWLDEPPTPLADMYFSASCALLLKLVAEAGHADAPVGETTAGALRDELAARALALAARFDERNGTSAQGDAVRELLGAYPLVDLLPLSAPARRAAERATGTVTGPVTGPVTLPDSPEELAELALRETRLRNLAAAEAAWRRFDEVCPEPEPALLARRLDAKAGDAANTEPERAKELWGLAAMLFEEVGDEVRRQAVLSRFGLLRCYHDEPEEGMALVAGCVTALEDAGDPDALARALMRLAIAHRVADRFDDSRATLARALEIALDETLLPEIELDIAQTVAAQGDQAEALVHAERSAELYAAVGPCGGLRLAQYLAGRFNAGAGALDRAWELLGEAALTDDVQLRADALHLRGRVGLDLDHVEETHQALADAVADLLTLDNATHVAYARVDLAAAALYAGRADEAADAAEEALPELERLGDAEEASRARFLLARAYQELGAPEQALELLAVVAEHCAAQDNPAGVGQMNAMAADILDRLDRDFEAAVRFGLAADAYGLVEATLPEVENRRRAAMAWRWAGEPDRSLEALARADSAASGLSGDEPVVVWQLAMLNYDGARILAAADRAPAAVERTPLAAGGFRALDATVEAALADALHGRLLLDLGRPGDAEKFLRAALDGLPEEAVDQRTELEELLAELTY